MKREHRKTITAFGWTFVRADCDCGRQFNYYLLGIKPLFTTRKYWRTQDKL